MPAFPRRFAALTLGSLALLAAGCNNDATGPGFDPGTGKALVLITYGDPGVSVVRDTGATAGHLAFGDAFDGALFTVVRDSVASASSKFGGDLLYLADVGSGGLQTVPLPAGSNPGGVAFVPSTVVGSTGARFAVALRDSGAIALVKPASGTAPRVTLLRDAGECPTDVFALQNAIWSVDANQNCRDLYQVLGPARLIALTVDDPRRDTLVLGDSAIGAARAFAVDANTAFVVTTGDYAGTPGRIVRVGMRGPLDAPAVGASRSLPEGYYATASRVGHDGKLYVTASLGYPADYAPRVYQVQLPDLQFVGNRASGQQYLDLRDSTGALVRCDAATADTQGSVYCASNGGVSSRLRIFSPAGALVRSVATGGLAADVEVR